MPDHPAVAGAMQLLNLGMKAEAMRSLQAALKKSPGDASLNYTLAGLLHEEGQDDLALLHAERAAASAPTVGLYKAFQGEVLMHLGKIPQATKLLSRGLELDPKLYAARVNLAMILVRELQYDRAEVLLREATALRPNLGPAVNNLALVLIETARADEAVSLLRDHLARQPGDVTAAGTLANLGNYSDLITPAQCAADHATFGRLVESAHPPSPPPPSSLDGVLDIGFLSPDFREHSVAYFIEPILSGLPRERWRVHGFFTGETDAMTSLLRSRVDVWHALPRAPHAAIEQAIRKAGVHVLVELSGITAGHALPVIARRPAPVQVTYLGYPNTTGLRQLQARIVDHQTDPPGSETYATEPLVRTEGCFLCFSPREVIEGRTHAPEAPARDVGPITFGSFNVISKLSGTTIALWSRVLREREGSRLLLKARSLGSRSLAERVLSRFGAHGIDPGRIDLVPFVPSHAEHLALYRRVDVALDPTPYNGTTTTCEALWMGVPVVTLSGRTHAARVGRSILHAAGLGEWVAEDEDGFVRTACALVDERVGLAECRRTLRSRLLTSTLCDRTGAGVRFGAALERVIAATLRGGRV